MNLTLASTIARRLRDALRVGLIEGRTCGLLEGFWNETLDEGSAGINTADIGYDKKNKIVYVPTFWKNHVVAYQLQ